MAIPPFTFINTTFWPIGTKHGKWRQLNITGDRILPWLYNCAFRVVTIEEQNGLGSISPMVSFETNPCLLMRLRLSAVKEEKMGLRCQSSASINHHRFLLFPLLEKGLSKKKRLVTGIGHQRMRCSSLRWTIRWLCLHPSWLGIAQTSLGLSTRYSVRSPFKSTVHFYRECERGVLCIWNRGLSFYLHIVFVPQMQPRKYSLTVLVIVEGLTH